MSDGRNKLNDFSLLKSLVSDKKIKDKTNRIRQAKDKAKHPAEPAASQSNQSKPSQQDHKTRRPASTPRPNKNQSRRQQRPDYFIMPQYGYKLERTIDPSQDVDTSQETLLITIDPKKQQEKAQQQLFKWLCQRFPKCFNPKDKKPLKVGISQDIMAVSHKEHAYPIDPFVLGQVLKRYVGDMRYQRAIFNHQQRFNLWGQAVEDLLENHIAHAKQRVEEIEEKARLREQGIDIKTYYQQKRQQQNQTTADHQETTEGSDSSTSQDTTPLSNHDTNNN